jgi:hypothetical protein
MCDQWTWLSSESLVTILFDTPTADRVCWPAWRGMRCGATSEVSSRCTRRTNHPAHLTYNMVALQFDGINYVNFGLTTHREECMWFHNGDFDTYIALFTWRRLEWFISHRNCLGMKWHLDKWLWVSFYRRNARSLTRSSHTSVRPAMSVHHCLRLIWICAQPCQTWQLLRPQSRDLPLTRLTLGE